MFNFELAQILLPIYFAMKGTNSLRKIYSLATLSWQGIGWSTMTSKDFEFIVPKIKSSTNAY